MMRFAEGIAACVIVFGIYPVAIVAQATFEVISVKQSVGDSLAESLRMNDDRVTIRNVPLSTIVLMAYNLAERNVKGMPDWARVQRYDIDAKASTTSTTPVLRQMMQAMLAERFNLRTHLDSKRTAAWALQQMPGRARLGSNLKAVDFDCRKPPARDDGKAAEANPCGLRRDIGLLMGKGFTMT